MAIDSFVSPSDQVYIDLAGPLHFDESEDPLYAWTPPTAAQYIDQLISTSKHPFKTLAVSVPHVPEPAAIQALTRLLSSQATASVETLRIAGSLSGLNDTYLQAALKTCSIRTLILQESHAVCDSYALAALLCAVDGITALHIAIDETSGTNVHRSFHEETEQVTAKLKRLQLSCKGMPSRTISKLFSPGSLVHVEELQVFFEAPEWTTDMTVSLMKGSSDFPALRIIKIVRSASDVSIAKPCIGEAILPLITKSTLEYISVSSERPGEGIVLPVQAIQSLPADLKSLNLVYAGSPNPIDVYYELQMKLNDLDHLEEIVMKHMYPDEVTSTLEDWEIVRVTTAGHPSAMRNTASTALAGLADALEGKGVSFNMRLLGHKVHEERAFLV